MRFASPPAPSPAGQATMSHGDFEDLRKGLEPLWIGEDYDLMRKNCW